MKTAEYKVTRVIIQTISMAMMVTNMGVFAYTYLCEFNRLEERLANKPTFLFSDMSMYVCAINMLFSVITACCITSKFKFWMALCEKALYMQIAFTCSAAFYFYCFYVSSVMTSVSEEMIDHTQGFLTLLKSYNIFPVRNSYVEGFRQHIEFVVNVFCIVQLAVAFGAYIQAKILGYTTTIDLEKKAMSAPKVEVMGRVGAQRMSATLKTIPKMNGTVAA
ncbi:uncharacterized protein VICG_01180 [Vittaforma corneae ATCC 50505]|uniref:Uncharacterized protein n=1 Tax=Vittaforma corneae (strain ATCC 50505) TaxID=993615 RepID=L2GLR3_VITCO|nr:uncharacterized protein VICG_01180 [Vittaforma corneae ATCC 50505]ELA41828.1 hypothetical protein VICG_01180 [Vittaforma corneae ATCC 50505]